MKSPKRFIVVDDDPTNNLICKFAITKASPDSNIRLFTEPEEALKQIKENASQSPVLLFLDINMPSMTGWDFQYCCHGTVYNLHCIVIHR